MPIATDVRLRTTVASAGSRSQSCVVDCADAVGCGVGEGDLANAEARDVTTPYYTKYGVVSGTYDNTGRRRLVERLSKIIAKR